jgi:hypothetical protein
MAQNYFGFVKPANKIVVAATDSTFYTEYKLEAATNAYAGRLMMQGTNADDVVVADGVTYMPLGFLGYEQSFMGSTSMVSNRPATVDTIYLINAKVPVLMGGGFWVVAAVPAGVEVRKGDMLAPWGGGLLVPVVPMMGGYALRVAFTKKTAEFDTGLDIPAGMLVRDVIVKPSTVDASGTIDIGLLSTESGGAADGFVDTESLATAGFVNHINGNSTAANNTLGSLLTMATVKSADGTALYADLPKFHKVATAVSISYTTSNHTVAGHFYIVMNGEGFQPVAVAEETLSATAAVTDLMVRSLI